jgi:hypothetical protein
VRSLIITTVALLVLSNSPSAFAQPADGAVSTAKTPGPASNGDVETFTPTDGISYELGSKRAMGFFEPRNGRCRVTLIIAEAVDPGAGQPRVSLPIRPGESATFTSEQGRSMELTCGEGAQTVSIKCGSNCRRHL